MGKEKCIHIYRIRTNFPAVIHLVSKNVRYLIVYNLKKPEQISLTFGMQYPDNLSF